MTDDSYNNAMKIYTTKLCKNTTLFKLAVTKYRKVRHIGAVSSPETVRDVAGKASRVNSFGCMAGLTLALVCVAAAMPLEA